MKNLQHFASLGATVPDAKYSKDDRILAGGPPEDIATISRSGQS